MSTSTVIPGVKREDWNQVTDGAKEVVGAVEYMVSHAVSAAGGIVSQAACDVSNKADQLVARAGTGIHKMGDSMGRNLPQNGMLGSASQSLAGAVQDAVNSVGNAFKLKRCWCLLYVPRHAVTQNVPREQTLKLRHDSNVPRLCETHSASHPEETIINDSGS